MGSKRSKSAHERILRKGQSSDQDGQKTAKKYVLAIFAKRPIKPLDRIFRTQNNCKKNFLSELQELEVQSKFGQNSQSSQIWVKLKTFVAPGGKKDF